MLAAVAVTALLAVAAAPLALAQAPPQPPSPPQQQQAAPPAADPAVQSTEPQLIYSPWVKVCNKAADPNAKQACFTVKDGRIESGLIVVGVAIIEMDGEQRKLVRLSLPYGVALQHGTRLIVDQQTPLTAPYVTCLPPVVPPGGCIADYEANAELIGRLKKGTVLTVQAIHINGQAMSPQFDLKDFAKAYDGPPTDPKVLEQQQKNLRDRLQKRSEDTGKTLENRQPPASVPTW